MVQFLSCLDLFPMKNISYEKKILYIITFWLISRFTLIVPRSDIPTMIGYLCSPWWCAPSNHFVRTVVWPFEGHWCEEAGHVPYPKEKQRHGEHQCSVCCCATLVLSRGSVGLWELVSCAICFRWQKRALVVYFNFRMGRLLHIVILVFTSASKGKKIFIIFSCFSYKMQYVLDINTRWLLKVNKGDYINIPYYTWLSNSWTMSLTTFQIYKS